MQLAELLPRVAMGDRSAFATVYRLSSPHLYAVILRILKRPAWAEDVLQECFISIWQNAHSYAASKSQPMTWLTSIVRNRALDWLRRKDSDAEELSDEQANEMPDEGPNPMDLLQASTDALRVRTCLQALDGSQQQSLALAFYHGMTHAELAEHLRQPLGTVKSWVRRGLLALKTCLDARRS